MALFISHSKKDTNLVDLVRQSLPLTGNRIVVYEDLPPVLAESSQDAKRIRGLIRDSSAVLLFHTANVEASEFTKAWVHYEVSQASAHEKSLVVFQPNGRPPLMPITYFTDLAPINLERPESVPNMQKIARSHGVAPLRENPVARAAAGAVGGAIFGPIGAGVGALAGLLTTPKKAINKVPPVLCRSCKVAFRFWGEKGVPFFCPSCLKHTVYKG